MQGGIFHWGPDDGLCFYWHDGRHAAASSQWNIDLTPIHLSLPPPLFPILSLSPSLLRTHIRCRQVGLICCIGHCQSSSLSCGNRSLMISILRLSRLRYIYCWTSPPSDSPATRYHLFSLFSNNFVAEIIHVFKDPISYIMNGESFYSILKQF